MKIKEIRTTEYIQLLKSQTRKSNFAAGRIAINQSKPFGIAKAVSVDKCICLLPWVNEEGRQTDYSTSN